MDLIYWSVRLCSRRGGEGKRGWMGGNVMLASFRSITLLDCIKIWCNIQVIIYRFFPLDNFILVCHHLNICAWIILFLFAGHHLNISPRAMQQMHSPEKKNSWTWRWYLRKKHCAYNFSTIQYQNKIAFFIYL